MEEYILYSTDTELEKYNGTKVKVIKPLNDNMYKVEFYDGCIGYVYEDELRNND